VGGISSAKVGEGPLLLSVATAAKHLGVSRGTLYELINRGEIEHVRIGRRILIAREALRKFIEANSRTWYDSASVGLEGANTTGT
jgi:excisionase family DNA binding protein